MNGRLTESFRKQVCYLLESTHIPRVAVRPSLIPGAGNGVFYKGFDRKGNRHIDEDDNSAEVLCLYPGVYTPPLPLSAGALSTLEDNNEIMDLYLAKQLPPSGINFQENAYILNLTEPAGGYLDGRALTSNDGRRLDDSPSACGHLVNHYGSAERSKQSNTQVVAFLWKDILKFGSELIENLPNEMRSDGSPWYFDTMEQKIIYFPENSKKDNPNMELDPLLAGAAITTRSDISISLQQDQELFLDYQLRPKALPMWAARWYR